MTEGLLLSMPKVICARLDGDNVLKLNSKWLSFQLAIHARWMCAIILPSHELIAIDEPSMVPLDHIYGKAISWDAFSSNDKITLKLASNEYFLHRAF